MEAQQQQLRSIMPAAAAAMHAAMHAAAAGGYPRCCGCQGAAAGPGFACVLSRPVALRPLRQSRCAAATRASLRRPRSSRPAQ